MAHSGITKMNEYIRTKYYFWGSSAEIERHVKACYTCQIKKSKNNRAPLSHNVASFPMELVSIDIGGPMRETSKGNKYFLVSVDAFTGLSVISLLKNITAEEVFSVFYNDVVCVHGCPITVKSDAGSQLIGEVSKAFFDMLATIRIVTTPYSPWSNGMSEVTVRRTKNIIAKFLIKQQHETNETVEWDSVIKHVQFAMHYTARRISPHLEVDALFGSCGRR